MIKITQTSSRQEDKTKIKSKKRSTKVQEDKKSFSVELQDSLVFEIKGEIEELISDLSDQEKSFMQNQSLYELNRYKAIVQKILKMVLDQGFKIKTLERSMKAKALGKSDFIIVDIINKKLLEISTEITRSNKAFNLMKTIEEIRGLIFDLIY